MAFFSTDKIKEKAKSITEDREQEKKYTILIVDDEPSNLITLAGMLDEDYHVLQASDGQEALNLVKQTNDSTQIDMIISDQRMPRLTGVEFLKQTIPYIPEAVRIILTGFTDIDAIIDSINEGGIYKFITKPFDPQDLTITIQRALEAYELKKANHEFIYLFEKFVPKQFLNRIAPEGLEYIEYGKAKSEKLTILFSDIHSFSKLSDTMEPQDLINFLNTYLNRMGDPIHENNGFIDKFIGDSIMALFDRHEQPVEKHAQDAVIAAIAMQKEIEAYNIQRIKNGYTPFKIGIGLHSGSLVVGTVGSEDRMDSTVLGDSVNLASRLRGLTKTYNAKILISESTYQLIDYRQFHVREVDTTRVKGKAESVTVYEIFDADPPEILEKKLATREQLEEGIRLFNASKDQEAVQCFEACLSLFPQDIVASEYIKRRYYQSQY